MRPGHKAKICTVNPGLVRLIWGILMNFGDTSKKTKNLLKPYPSQILLPKKQPGFVNPRWTSPAGAGTWETDAFLQPGHGQIRTSTSMTHWGLGMVKDGQSLLLRTVLITFYYQHPIFAGMVTWTFINRYFDVRRVPGYQSHIVWGIQVPSLMQLLP